MEATAQKDAKQVRAENSKISKELCALLEEFLEKSAKATGMEFISGLSKLFDQLKEKGLTTEVARTYWLEMYENGHQPLVGIIITLPGETGRRFVREAKAGAMDKLFPGIIAGLKEFDRWTALLGKNIWCSVLPQERIIDWCNHDIGEFRERFFESLTLLQVDQYIKFGFEKSDWFQKEILEPAFAKKLAEKTEQVKTIFQQVIPANALEIIWEDQKYFLKYEFPKPLGKELLFAFVSSGLLLQSLDTNELKKWVDKTRSVALAKALLEREDYKSSFDRFMFTVELSTNTKK